MKAGDTVIVWGRIGGVIVEQLDGEGFWLVKVPPGRGSSPIKNSLGWHLEEVALRDLRMLDMSDEELIAGAGK